MNKKVYYWGVPAVVGALLGFGYLSTETHFETCARLASHPEEGIIISGSPVGVSFDRIDKAEAVKACRQAVAADGNPRSKYHLSRALLSGEVLVNELEEAKELSQSAINSGYAFANIGAGFIAYNFQPSSGILAESYYKAAMPVARQVATNGIAYSLLFQEDTADRRDEGVEIMMSVAASDPNAYLVLSSFYQSLPKNRENWKKAEAMLLRADEAGLAQANIELARLYWEDGSPIKNEANARKRARRSTELGFNEGYEIWIQTYYHVDERRRDFTSAYRVAVEGAKAGNMYANYIAGHMSYFAQGTQKDSLQAESYLQTAAKLGSVQAKKLLDEEVRYRANELRRMPKSNPQKCIERRLSSFDRDIIDYYNGCSYSINVLICSRFVATEVFSFFDGKDRERCRTKLVGAGQYVDNFYGANENSSLARKAVSNTNVRIGACHPPMVPKFQGTKVICRES